MRLFAQCCLALALMLALFAAAPLSVSAVELTPNAVTINADGTMTVDGQPFKIKGVAYSIVPIGESERTGTKGDYFTADYAYMWARDLPMLKSVGINTLRVYSWSTEADHTAFLDACAQFGMRVFVTHALGYARDNPADTLERQDAIIQRFAEEVARYGDHPAILMWSFGNELNGYWLGFLDQFNELHQCGWNTDQVEQGGCIRSTTPQCIAAQNCVYSHYFGWIDRALQTAKQHTTRPMTATMADIDNIVGPNPATDLLPRFRGNMTHFDAFAFQLYRGQSFYPAEGPDYFTQYGAEAGGKPLIVAEYGVDAMNDPCGWPENFPTMQPCTVWSPGQNGQPGGSDDTGADFVGCLDDTRACRKPGVSAQAEWDASLTGEISTAPHTLGGFIFEWHDEYWKSVETEDSCAEPSSIEDLAANTAALLSDRESSPFYYNYSDPDGAPKRTGAAKCTYKAHISCGNGNNTYQDVCGYFLWASPDGYVNEAWFGLNRVTDCGDMVGSGASASHHLTALTPRPALKAITSVYGGAGDVAASQTCEQLRPCWACVTAAGARDTANGACNSECGLLLNHVNTDNSTATSSTGANNSTATSSTGANNSTGGDDGNLDIGAATSSTASAVTALLLAGLAVLLSFA